ncbi:serine recombinase [Clostridia bacterium]|nr:serine recombinase [Clostridia bacterium]
MNNRINAVYARQSIDKTDSISIESQIEFCKYELKGGEYREYTDKGYSGKNTDRPDFQKLLRDIEAGLVSKVIVYKLDRISRSIIDFAGMMALFQRYNVEFVSSTEKFDTSTPMGRAMLNICIVFAQLERETIVSRVTDAFYSRLRKGLHMCSAAPYGYRLEPFVINGIKTKRLIVEPEEAKRIRLIFEMYAEPHTSYGDITRYFAEQGILFYGKSLIRSIVAKFLRNPVYVMADLDIYEFYKSQGAEVVNEPEDFTGLNGCYFYREKGTPAKNRYNEIQGRILVLAPHEGIIPADLWLKCRRKLMGNIKFQGGRKVKNTWLAGKIKCGNCGYALASNCNQPNRKYFQCHRRRNDKSCEGAGLLRVDDTEAFIYGEMVKKLREFKTLTSGKKVNANPKLTAARLELTKVQGEIETLIDSLTGASGLLMSYANEKIAALDAKRQELLKAIADLSAETVSTEQIETISNYLDDWKNTDFDGKRRVVDILISRISATSENVDIEWKL